MFYPQIARESYNAKTGEYVPEWKRIAKMHKRIKISESDFKSACFGPYSPAYVTTNEDWRFAVQQLAPANKSVLTVTGSGDQAVAFTTAGAKNVDTFDTTFFAKVMMDIKTSAIQTMNHAQYNNFIKQLHDTRYINELQGYAQIEQVCPKPSIIAAKQMRGYKIFNQGLGACREYMPTEPEYNNAKKFVHAPINFIWSDLAQLHYHLGKKKYDIIYLSNIFEYFLKSQDITNVLNNLQPHLTEKGQIMLYTSWIHTNTSAIIVNAALNCDWGRVQSHETKNAVMLTMDRAH